MSNFEMPPLIDHDARRKFVEEIDRPFSVIAPAGVGKTYAIVERVERMLLQNVGEVALVTYTKKAAAQMQARLEERFLKNRKTLPREQIFIGTIHSLCLELMQKHSAEWGLAPKMEVCGDAEGLLAAFMEECPNPLDYLPVKIQERYWRYFEGFGSEVLLKVGAAGQNQLPSANEFVEQPAFNFHPLFASTIGGVHKRTVERLKTWAKELLEISGKAGFVMPKLPKPPEETSPVWEVYQTIFKDFEAWKAHEGMRFARALAARFYGWRLQKGVYLYEDLIRIVLEKISVENANAVDGGSLSDEIKIQEKNNSDNKNLSSDDFRAVKKRFIILDEAQDTSPDQLDLLKHLACHSGGRLQLTMVGDPQQSIYSERASLPHYLAMHRDLVAREGAEALTFEVTFRCSQAVVNWVNATGNLLLKPSPTQAAFVTLQAKPNATTGEVFRWEISGEPAEEGASAEERDWAFARAFARQFSELKIPREELHQVAVLAARREWLFKLAATLREAGVPVQLHAESSTLPPAERILKAILHLLAHPFDSFELVGLLREVTGVDDRTLAAAARNFPQAMTLLSVPTVPSQPSEALLTILQSWQAVYEKYRLAPLEKALTGFLAEIQIERIINDLASVYGDSFRREWRTGLARVLALAASGKTLRELLQALENSREETPVITGALQLMTLHKSKGLEWPIVILPFLNRENEAHKANYPAINPDDAAALAWKLPRPTAPHRENLERLLYVAMTRAKEQLILVDDGEFFSQEELTAAVLLEIDAKGARREAFLKLRSPQGLALGGEAETPMTPEIPDLNLPRVPMWPLITPSSLVAEISAPPIAAVKTNTVNANIKNNFGGNEFAGKNNAEGKIIFEERNEKISGGIDYGDAWHSCMDIGNWHREGLRQLLETRIGQGTFAPRLRAELELLLKSELWPILCAPRNKTRTELPFFVALEDFALEGRVDLLINAPERVLIVDWKTDAAEPEELKRLYAPQMAAYQRAFEKLTGRKTETALYSTVAGKLIFTNL